jgi:hypothetical protein
VIHSYKPPATSSLNIVIYHHRSHIAYTRKQEKAITKVTKTFLMVCSLFQPFEPDKIKETRNLEYVLRKIFIRVQ